MFTPVIKEWVIHVRSTMSGIDLPLFQSATAPDGDLDPPTQAST